MWSFRHLFCNQLIPFATFWGSNTVNSYINIRFLSFCLISDCVPLLVRFQHISLLLKNQVWLKRLLLRWNSILVFVKAGAECITKLLCLLAIYNSLTNSQLIDTRILPCFRLHLCQITWCLPACFPAGSIAEHLRFWLFLFFRHVIIGWTFPWL